MSTNVPSGSRKYLSSTALVNDALGTFDAGHKKHTQVKGWTRIPNALIEAMLDMSEAELKIILIAARKTYGWQKEYDAISLSQFQNESGLSRASVISGIKAAVKHGHLEELGTAKRGTKIYRLGIAISEITDPHQLSYADYLKTPHWHSVRRQALKRAHYRCQVCNSTEKLDVHHRTYERLGSERDNDVIALCRDCHQTFHDNGRVKG